MKDIFRTIPFWAVFLAIALFNLTISGFVNNTSSLYQTMGVDADEEGFAPFPDVDYDDSDGSNARWGEDGKSNPPEQS